MERDLFGPVPPAQPTTPGRGPKGGKHYTRPAGYAGTPGTGPDGKRCQDCAYYVSHQSYAGNTYPKCLKCKPRWTRGRATDILARSPACQYFEPAHD